MQSAFDIASLSHPAELPSGFERLVRLNESVGSRWQTIVDIFSFYGGQVTEILAIPNQYMETPAYPWNGPFKEEYRKVWVGVVIPAKKIHERDEYQESPFCMTIGPEVQTEVTSTFVCLWLSLLRDIHEGHKSVEEIQEIYMAFRYWEMYSTMNDHEKTFSFRPEDPNTPMDQFAKIMRIKGM